MQLQIQVANSVGQVKASDAASLVRGFCDARHVKCLPRVVLDTCVQVVEVRELSEGGTMPMMVSLGVLLDPAAALSFFPLLP
jgi:hypothetical protein